MPIVIAIAVVLALLLGLIYFVPLKRCWACLGLGEFDYYEYHTTEYPDDSEEPSGLRVRCITCNGNGRLKLFKSSDPHLAYPPYMFSDGPTHDANGEYITTPDQELDLELIQKMVENR